MTRDDLRLRKLDALAARPSLRQYLVGRGMSEAVVAAADEAAYFEHGVSVAVNVGIIERLLKNK